MSGLVHVFFSQQQTKRKENIALWRNLGRTIANRTFGSLQANRTGTDPGLQLVKISSILPASEHQDQSAASNSNSISNA
jgi:hypothetical protein